MKKLISCTLSLITLTICWTDGGLNGGGGGKGSSMRGGFSESLGTGDGGHIGE